MSSDMITREWIRAKQSRILSLLAEASEVARELDEAKVESSGYPQLEALVEMFLSDFEQVVTTERARYDAG